MLRSVLAHTMRSSLLNTPVPYLPASSANRKTPSHIEDTEVAAEAAAALATTGESALTGAGLSVPLQSTTAAATSHALIPWRALACVSEANSLDEPWRCGHVPLLQRPTAEAADVRVKQYASKRQRQVPEQVYQ
mmetsp:Transcript_27276/g.45461  ORF Transcript_27276/g.45461 Transcript_27276/m.45461 type:complete len:134 (+) Transcript_27276:1212-1613(+)